MPGEAAGSAMSRLQLLGLALLILTSLPHLTTARKTIQVSIALDSTPAIRLPRSFMGLSLGPLGAAEYIASDKWFIQSLKHLVAYRTGPLSIRWGGHSQEDSNDGISKAGWASIAKLYKVLDGRLLFTVPISMKGGPKVAQTQLDAAISSGLPGKAVSCINLGNEPEVLEKAKDLPSAYYDKALEIMEALAPKLKTWLNTTKVFCGPALSTRHKGLKPEVLVSKWAKLSNDDSDPYTKVYTTHYYAGTAAPDAAENLSSFAHIMSEREAIAIHTAAAAYATVAAKQGLAFKIDETGSVAHGGAPGISNSMAGALWVVDHSLSMLQAGVRGLNFHASGCSAFSPVLFPGACIDPSLSSQQAQLNETCPYTCGQKNAPALINAPLYGMLFVQKLLRNAAKVHILPRKGVIMVNKNDLKAKLYVLKTDKHLRIVVINKELEDEGAVVEVTMPVTKHGQWGVATLMQLQNEEHSMRATAAHIFMAGQQISSTGLMDGQFTSCKVLPKDSGKQKSFSIPIPHASAVVLVVPRKPDGSNQKPKKEELCPFSQ